MTPPCIGAECSRASRAERYGFGRADLRHSLSLQLHDHRGVLQKALRPEVLRHLSGRDPGRQGEVGGTPPEPPEGKGKDC